MGFAEASAGDEGEHQVYAKEVADKKVIEVLFMKVSAPCEPKLPHWWALDTGYGIVSLWGLLSPRASDIWGNPFCMGRRSHAKTAYLIEAAEYVECRSISNWARLSLASSISNPSSQHASLILAELISLHSQLSTDSKIGKFWTGMSKKDEREQAEIVLEVAFGEGPNGLSPDDARYIHDTGRGMKENDYDQFLKCFKDTLKEINKVANIIPKEKVDEAVDNFNKFKKSFVK
jgi:hypothetical protein